MESQQISLKIPCPIHTTEFVQRVHTEVGAEQQLYCLECVLSNEDITLSSNLKTIPDLIDTAANFYARNKQSLNLGSQVPAEYLELVSGQGEKLEQLSKHIELEKKKVSDIFDSIMKDTVKMISEKKNEYLNSLDQQLFNLRYWYIFFDKQLKKAFPSEEDIPFLFPTKEDLMGKLGKITNATQLTAFVRNLKEDLNEQHILAGSNMNIERGRQTYIQNLSKELLEVQDIKPYFAEDEEFNFSNFKSELQNNFSNLVAKLFDLKDPIRDVIKEKNYDSKFVKYEEFSLIKSWMPKNVKFNPKLLYRASRDGFNGQAFHKLCDGKKNTLTLVQAEWPGVKPATIGGFMDQPWTSASQYIISSNSFIFSTTTKKKAQVSNSTYGGYSNSNQGPSFGCGYDLGLMLNSKNNQSNSYMNPHSYTGTKDLISAKNYGGAGQSFFKPLEIEVYSLD